MGILQALTVLMTTLGTLALRILQKAFQKSGIGEKL